jgi:hypothetical protein
MPDSVQVDEVTPKDSLDDERREAVQHQLSRAAKRVECDFARSSNR